MASNNQYEYENEESIDKNLQCVICNEPFIDPVTTPCQHSFCRQCLEHWLQHYNSTCPTCRKAMPKNSLIPIILRPFLAILDQILVKCKLCDQCHIERGNFPDHINKICPKTIVTCPANDIHCPWTGLREELQTHLSVCTFESLRSRFNQNKNKNEQQVGKPINEITHNRRSIFRSQNYANDLIIMQVNSELQQLSNQEIAAAAREVIINNQCTHLNLFDHQLSPENVSLIASALPGNTSLKSLELGKCSIYDPGVRILAESLSTHNSLECLDLYHNFVTDFGAEYLAEMLRMNKSLSRLKLAYNRIGRQGMGMLANVLVSHNSNLQRLSLTGNKLIDDSCIYSIFSIIRYNQTLKTLNLEDCNLSWTGRMLIQFCQRVYLRTDLEILL